MTSPGSLRRSSTAQADGAGGAKRTSAPYVDDRMVCLMRLVLAVSALVIVYLDPAGPNRLVPVTYAALILYTLYSAALYALRVRSDSWRPAVWVTWADVFCYLVLVSLSGGAKSIFFFFFFFSIIEASFRRGLRSGLCVTLVSAALFTLVGYLSTPPGPALELNRLLLRPIYLVVLGYMIARWGEAEIQLKRRLELLREVNTLSPLPAGLTATPAGAGTLTISGNAAASAGTYNVGFKVTDPSNASNTATVQFAVGKEKAATAYTGDTSVVTAGPTVTTATFRLGANLAQEPDGAAGDITLARVTFELFKSNNLTNTPDFVVSNVAVDAAGNTAPTTISNMAADTYVVKVLIGSANDYWTANPVGFGTFNVTVGTNDQRTNGGGWVADAASANGRSNFGFTVRNEKGTPKGTFVYVFRGADGFTYVVKNNSWQGGFLNFASEAGTLARSSFKGRCNVQKVDPATGLTVQSWGNFTFTADVRDGDLFDPRQADGFAILLQDGGGQVWRQVGTSAAPAPLGGGNVQVKGK